MSGFFKVFEPSFPFFSRGLISNSKGDDIKYCSVQRIIRLRKILSRRMTFFIVIKKTTEFEIKNTFINERSNKGVIMDEC